MIIVEMKPIWKKKILVFFMDFGIWNFRVPQSENHQIYYKGPDGAFSLANVLYRIISIVHSPLLHCSKETNPQSRGRMRTGSPEQEACMVMPSFGWCCYCLDECGVGSTLPLLVFQKSDALSLNNE